MNLRYLDDVVTLKQIISRCMGCEMCLEVCPHGVWSMKDKKAVIADRNACMECGACAKNCPNEAIELKSGVGCARGIINKTLFGTSSNCDCNCGQ